MDLTKTSDQVVLLGICMGMGCVGGFIFDLYRRVRNRATPGPWLTALGDIIYWIVISAITFNLFLRISFGQVRGYMFLVLGMGLFFYHIAISPWIIKSLVTLDLWAYSLYRWVKGLLFKVFRCKIFVLPSRIWTDARRIYSKLTKNSRRK